LFVPGQPLEGEFIPGVDGKKIPVRGILPTIDFSIPRTINQGKNLLKGGAIGVGVSLGIDWLLSQIGAVIDQGVVKVPSIQIAPLGDGYTWHSQNIGDTSKPFSTPLDACSAGVSFVGYSDPRISEYPGSNSQIRRNCSGLTPSGQRASLNYVYRLGQSCSDGYTYDSEKGACVKQDGLRPATDPEIDLMFDTANQQNAAWLKGLLNDVCAASPSPARCFEEMKQNSALNGPASVPGPTTTQTTNSVSPAGVATQTVTTTKNTYNFTYGPTYYDYRKTTQIITTENGEPKSDTTIEEPVEPEQEERPPEEQQEEPVLCAGQGCDGPAYVDQYEPTDVTKEEAIDSYMSRIQSIPIIAAVGGLFSVNVDGSCPVWEVNSTLNIMGASMPIDLRFDYLCLPWVVSLKPWIQAVMIAVCLMLAIRIALL